MLAQERQLRSPKNSLNDRDILKQRTREMLSRELCFISNPAFAEMDEAECWREILGRPRGTKNSAPNSSSKPSLETQFDHLCEASLLTATEERKLFRAMNYMKLRANRIRATLNVNRPSVRKLEEVDECVQAANELRNEIVAANTRLIVSIAKKLASEKMNFEDLLSEGLASLLNATEKFDYARGFRFSTYATMVVRRALYRYLERSQRTKSRFVTGQAEVLDAESQDPVKWAPSESKLAQRDEQLSQLLSKLDDRERLILEARCGFIDIGVKATLSNLGDKLGVCKERVRQLEIRAVRKIQDAIAKRGIVNSLQQFVVQ